MIRALWFALLLLRVVSSQTLPVRFEPDLVQLDAVVTARDGRRVDGLQAEDFEVLQDGKRQPITSFSFVGEGPRTMAVLIDDVWLGLDDYSAIRKALSRFIDEDLRPGDRVSLIYLSHGSGALRQFTSDRPQLHRALDAMHWRPPDPAAMTLGDVQMVRELRHVLAELGTFPGRKSVVLVAPVPYGIHSLDVREVAEIANRSSTTIYAIGAQAGPLAEATGGTFVKDSSGAFDQLRDAAQTNWYYLIGWHPGPHAFGSGYRRLQIRARDKKLLVRTREGFVAFPDPLERPPAATASEQLRRTLVSPFRAGALDVRLAAGFVRQEPAGSTVDLLMHLAPEGVRFEQDAAGCWNAQIEAMWAAWPLDPGLPPSARVTTHTLDVHECGPAAARMKEEGLVATVQERVPSPGGFQIRVAVRSGDRFGAAMQFLTLPDLRRKAMAVSRVELWTADRAPAPSGDMVYRPAADGDPASRRFGAGNEVHYAFRTFGEPDEIRLRVLRAGHEVWSRSKAAPAGVLPIDGLSPGVYVLGVAALKKAERAEEWIDFEIQ